MQTNPTIQYSLNIPRNSSEDLTSSLIPFGGYAGISDGIKNLPRRYEAVAEYSQQIQREALNASSNAGSARSVQAILKQLDLQEVVQSLDGLSVTLERLDDLLFAEAEE